MFCNSPLSDIILTLLTRMYDARPGPGQLALQLDFLERLQRQPKPIRVGGITELCSEHWSSKSCPSGCEPNLRLGV